MPLIRSFARYLLPQDKDDVLTQILAMIAAATVEIRVCAYGFTHPQITQALIDAHARGVDVELLLDHSQECGPSEKKQVALLQGAGVPFWIGTSPEHQIRHSKTIVVDRRFVESGSLNYSESAFGQNNTSSVETDSEVALWMIKDWDDNKAWLIANEPQYQIGVAPVSAAK